VDRTRWFRVGLTPCLLTADDRCAAILASLTCRRSNSTCPASLERWGSSPDSASLLCSARGSRSRVICNTISRSSRGERGREGGREGRAGVGGGGGRPPTFGRCRLCGMQGAEAPQGGCGAVPLHPGPPLPMRRRRRRPLPQPRRTGAGLRSRVRRAPRAPSLRRARQQHRLRLPPPQQHRVFRFIPVSVPVPPAAAARRRDGGGIGARREGGQERVGGRRLRARRRSGARGVELQRPQARPRWGPQPAPRPRPRQLRPRAGNPAAGGRGPCGRGRAVRRCGERAAGGAAGGGGVGAGGGGQELEWRGVAPVLMRQKTVAKQRSNNGQIILEQSTTVIKNKAVNSGQTKRSKSAQKSAAKTAAKKTGQI
jgi:hypothetical protein